MKVVVVEDQSLFRDFITDLLRNRFQAEIAAVAEDGESALQCIREHRPNLVILDILIPRLSGIHVARTVQKDFPRTRILALSAEIDIKTVHQVQQLNLPGYVDKNEATVEVLSEAIETVRDGGRFYSSGLQKSIRKIRTDPLGFHKILTRREQEILAYIGGGLSDPEIGKILGLSETSVQTHRRNLLRKLDLNSTPELIRFAQESGFWKPSFRRMGLDDTYHIHS
jgi:DNA-binding NarL/FixJ family response regulator